MSIVLLLSTFWDAAAPEEAQDTAQKSKASSRQGIAVGLMDTLTHVQFCRMRLSAYSVLLQSLLQTTASSPKVSSAKHSIPERFCEGCVQQCRCCTRTFLPCAMMLTTTLVLWMMTWPSARAL